MIIREKSNRSRRIYFVASRDEKNRKVCLINEMEDK